MRNHWLIVALLGSLLILQAAKVTLAADDKDSSKDDEDADVQVEEEKDEKSDDSKKDDEKKDDKKKDDENEETKTVKVGDKEIPLEKGDRTVTNDVTMEISVNKEVIGNVTFGLFGKQCPKTVKNFLTLSNPTRGERKGYKGSQIHRVIRGFAIQGGDYISNDGSGGWSIYGPKFRDESFDINHFPFCLSMANSGPDSNGSQFFVPVVNAKWLNGKHVVFGQVESGHKIVTAINALRVSRFHRPLRKVWISNTWTEERKPAEEKNEEEKTEL